MLRGEADYMVRDLLRLGVSVSEIARRTGHDRKTIRAVRERAQRPLLPTQVRPSLLDPYAPYLEQRLALGVLNASKLYDEVRRQGYAGGVAVVRRFLSPRRPHTPRVTERFETLPGQQGQVDWAHCGYLWQGEHRRALSAFVLTLGYSRRQYVEFTLSQDLAHFLRCHVHAIAYFGGVPAELLYDNLKTAVDHRTAEGSIVWHSGFRDFADYYGYVPRACQPYRAQTKGKVERGIRYLKGNFLLGLDLSAHTIESLNRDVLVWLRETADVRLHGTTYARPIDRFAAEQAALLSVGSRPPYDTSSQTPRLVNREGFVGYRGARYAVPPEYAGRLVLLKESEDGQLRIVAGSQCINEYRLAAADERVVSFPGHTTAVRSLARTRPTPPPAETAAPPRAWPQVEVRDLAAYDAAAGLGGA